MHCTIIHIIHFKLTNVIQSSQLLAEHMEEESFTWQYYILEYELLRFFSDGKMMIHPSAQKLIELLFTIYDNIKV